MLGIDSVLRNSLRVIPALSVDIIYREHRGAIGSSQPSSFLGPDFSHRAVPVEDVNQAIKRPLYGVTFVWRA